MPIDSPSFWHHFITSGSIDRPVSSTSNQRAAGLTVTCVTCQLQCCTVVCHVYWQRHFSCHVQFHAFHSSKLNFHIPRKFQEDHCRCVSEFNTRSWKTGLLYRFICNCSLFGSLRIVRRSRTSVRPCHPGRTRCWTTTSLSSTLSAFHFRWHHP